jgi:protein-S-isoprenylcysteine O-methyltransferase Ste14
MSIWDSLAGSIQAVAKGDRQGRNFVKALLPLILYLIIALLILASFWVDRWLALPVFRFTWWGIGLSVILLALGFAIDAWIIVTFRRASGTPWPFKPPLKLITTGIYAHVRNPMALAGILIGEGLGCLFGSLSLIIIFIPLLTLLGILYLKAVEERELELRFGKEYLEYKKKVPMLIPKLRRSK